MDIMCSHRDERSCTGGSRHAPKRRRQSEGRQLLGKNGQYRRFAVLRSDRALTEKRVLVGGRLNRKGAIGIEGEPGPARTLDGGGSGVEFLLEGVKAAKLAVDLGLERAILEDTTGVALVVSGALCIGAPGRGHVLPKKRVIDVTFILLVMKEEGRDRICVTYHHH